MASHVASDRDGDKDAETDAFSPLRSQAVKVVGVKAHTEQDRRQVMLDLYLR